MADDLEAQIKAGRAWRHDARAMTAGYMLTSGKWRCHVDLLELAVTVSDHEPDVHQLLNRDLLELHHWRFDGKYVIPPSKWPGDAPLEAPGPDDGAEASSDGGGGGTISRRDARREIRAVWDYEDWAAEMRQYDIWTQAQERRKLFLGRAVLPNVLKSPESIETMRRIAAKGGDAAEIELWSDEDLRADYTPAPVGLEGASKSGR